MDKVSEIVRYPIYERFATIQGEGLNAGRPVYLVRLMGCDQHCPWCDAAGTWHKDYMPKDEKVEALNAEQIYHAARKTKLPVLLTGGEPTLHNLKPILDKIHPIYIETAGHTKFFDTYLPRPEVWITLSPKLFPGARWPKFKAVQYADEIKLIVDSVVDLQNQLAWVAEHPALAKRDSAPVVWIHPEWSKRNDRALLKAVVEAVAKSVEERPRLVVRAGWQIHKLYLADPNPQGKVVPLGGNPELGASI